jgi:hypothetical protein
MSTMQAAPMRRDLAAVNEAIRYARGVMPTTLPPDLGVAFYARVDIGLHRVPVDVFHAALAVNDDLPWGPVRHYRDQQRGDQYWSATLELPYARLAMFTEHEALTEEHDHG